MEYFVTGTGTGIGKTFVTALIANGLAERGIRTGVLKWVSTGSAERAADLEFIASHCPLLAPGNSHGNILSSVYCLEFPASPHLAAEMQGTRIEPERLVAAFHETRSVVDVLLVEGAGGLMVPLARDTLLVDLVSRLSIPSFLVAASGLGTINHTLLSLDAMKARNIECAAVILNSQGAGRDEENDIIVKDNRRVIEESGGTPVAGVLPRVESWERAVDSCGETVREIIRIITGAG